MMSSIFVISRWIESRSIGVMNVLCSASTQRCVIVSVSCSMSEIRRHFAAMFAPVVTIDRNSFVPSIVSAACCSKKSKKLVSRGKNRPNIEMLVTRLRSSRHRLEGAIAQEPSDQHVCLGGVHDPCVRRVDFGERGHAVEHGL